MGVGTRSVRTAEDIHIGAVGAAALPTAATRPLRAGSSHMPACASLRMEVLEKAWIARARDLQIEQLEIMVETYRNSPLGDTYSRVEEPKKCQKNKIERAILLSSAVPNQHAPAGRNFRNHNYFFRR